MAAPTLHFKINIQLGIDNDVLTEFKSNLEPSFIAANLIFANNQGGIYVRAFLLFPSSIMYLLIKSSFSMLNAGIGEFL